MAKINSLYEQDYYAWALKNAELLRQGRFAEVDREHIAEELEDVGKSERRALESHIRNVLLHLLKWRYQSTLRGASWRQSIRNGREEVKAILEESPSLVGQIPNLLAKSYPRARLDAADETGLPEKTFPDHCPFTLEQVLDAGFWPENGCREDS